MGVETLFTGLGLATTGPSGVTLFSSPFTASLFSGLSSLSTGFSIFSGLSSIAGGFASQQESGYQAELAAQQVESRAIEEERLVARESRLEQERSEDYRKRQKVAYLASGVTLEGSPLLMMEDTRRRGAENVEEIKRSGGAAASAIREEGRLRARRLRMSGRRSFSEGLRTGGRSIFGGLTRYG